MYLTEKDLKLEIRQVNATINELASDQAGDILKDRLNES